MLCEPFCRGEDQKAHRKAEATPFSSTYCVWLHPHRSTKPPDSRPPPGYMWGSCCRPAPRLCHSSQLLKLQSQMSAAVCCFSPPHTPCSPRRLRSPCHLLPTPRSSVSSKVHSEDCQVPTCPSVPSLRSRGTCQNLPHLPQPTPGSPAVHPSKQ